MPTTLVMLSQKGGSGKTSIAATLFAAMVSRGYSSGIMDLDGQGNATGWALGVEQFLATPGDRGSVSFTLPDGRLADFAARGIPGEWPTTPEQFLTNTHPDLVPCSRLPGGWVVPSNPHLAIHRVTEARLDLVPLQTLLVDTPPNLPTVLLRSLVGQSDFVIVPVTAEPFAVANVELLLADIQDAGRGDMLTDGTLRIVITQRKRCAVHEAGETYLRKHWPRLVSKLVAQDSAAWPEAVHAAVPWNRKSRPAVFGAELLKEVEAVWKKRSAAA